jgi:hypothetical protein
VGRAGEKWILIDENKMRDPCGLLGCYWGESENPRKPGLKRDGKLGVVAYVCNLGTWEAAAGGSPG